MAFACDSTFYYICRIRKLLLCFNLKQLKLLLRLMSKAISYYDWELNFKKKNFLNIPQEDNIEEVNSLGISKDKFKDYMKKWKSKNIF